MKQNNSISRFINHQVYNEHSKEVRRGTFDVRILAIQSNLTLEFSRTTLLFYKSREIDLCFVDEFMVEVGLHTN